MKIVSLSGLLIGLLSLVTKTDRDLLQLKPLNWETDKWDFRLIGRSFGKKFVSNSIIYIGVSGEPEKRDRMPSPEACRLSGFHCITLCHFNIIVVNLQTY